MRQTEVIREQAYRSFSAVRYREAIEDCFRAIAADPWCPWCYYLIGMSLSAMGGESRQKQAILYLERYLELETTKFSASRQKAVSLIGSLRSAEAEREGHHVRS